MSKRYTQEEVKILLEKHGCKLLSEYKNTTTTLKIKCKCGNVFEKTLKVMNKSKKYMCNNCIKNILTKAQTMPYEEVKNKIANLGYKLLTSKDEYTKASDKCKIQCDKGHIYYQIPLDLFKGHKCKKCATEEVVSKQRLNKETILKILQLKNLEWIDEDYKSNDLPIKVKCKKCNHIFYPTIHNLKSGSRCPNCFELNRGKKKIIPYEKRVEYIEKFGFKILTPKEEYINGSTKIKFKCSKGHIYTSDLNHFYSGNRCPICNKSKGETSISNFLNNNNIEYIEQYKFKDCKYKRPLPFDFYIPSLNLCIEYDGKQHYEIDSFYNEIDDFIEIKIRDTIKNIYCKQNNIDLLRIPYFNYDNIEQILTEKLLNCNKQEQTSTTIPGDVKSHQ